MWANVSRFICSLNEETVSTFSHITGCESTVQTFATRPIVPSIIDSTFECRVFWRSPCERWISGAISRCIRGYFDIRGRVICRRKIKWLTLTSLEIILISVVLTDIECARGWASHISSVILTPNVESMSAIGKAVVLSTAACTRATVLPLGLFIHCAIESSLFIWCPSEHRSVRLQTWGTQFNNWTGGV